MTPNNTNEKRNIDNFAFRARANEARIRTLREHCSRIQVSVLILVQTSISQAESFRCRLEFVPRGSGGSGAVLLGVESSI
jgi:hypothetical protein